MSFKPVMARWAKWLLATCLLAMAAGCASPVQSAGTAQYHAFGFDAYADSPDTEILAFKYGPGGIPQLQSPFWKDATDARQAVGIHATMSIEGGLYVKWRLRSTGQIFEDTVDLRAVLQRDLTNQRVYFVAQGNKLFVYLSDLSKQKPQYEPIVGPFRIQLYPTQLIYSTSR